MLLSNNKKNNLKIRTLTLKCTVPEFHNLLHCLRHGSSQIPSVNYLKVPGLTCRQWNTHTRTKRAYLNYFFLIFAQGI